mgnify:CR=1 FL=1|jgi:hypothetical protein
MNRYDKEERIIQTFQDLKRWRIKIFPLNSNNILLYRLYQIYKYERKFIKFCFFVVK